MAAAPENDILNHLSDIENAIMPILENLLRENVPFDDVRREIDEVRVMIQNIIDDGHNDEHRDILDRMIEAVAAAELAVNPQDPRLNRSENDAIIALNEVIHLMEDLRSQHVGGYRKRKRRTHRKHRTQRRRNRRRTHRNRK
jgi:hypothetical protein